MKEEALSIEPPPTARACLGYLAAGALALVVYSVLPDGLVQDAFYLLVGGSAVVAVEVGVRRNHPAATGPWRWMAAGLLLWVVGDALSSWSQDVAHTNAYPSWADVSYLLAYPVFGVAYLRLIRQYGRRRSLVDILDSAIVAVAAGLLSWVLLVNPTLRAGEASVGSAIVDVAYPTGDILLLGLLVMLMTTGGRTPAFRMLLGAMAALLAADVFSLSLNLWSSPQNGWGDTLWLAAYVLWGAAALHPSMRSLASGARPMPDRFGVRRVGALAVAMLIPALILVLQRALSVEVDALAVAIGGGTLSVLVLARVNQGIVLLAASQRDRERAQSDLAFQAAHDALTGLPNRTQAVQAMTASLARTDWSDGPLALLFLDLDGFKAINDTFGHLAGDHVLRTAATRLREGVRGTDFVARLGGDEFVVILDELPDRADAVRVAERLIERVSQPITLLVSPRTGERDGDDPDEHAPPARRAQRGRGSTRSTATVGVSIGIAFGQESYLDPDQLLFEADTAAYQAKRAGRGRVEVFDDSMRKGLHDQLALEGALRHGIDHDELCLYFQPVVAVGNEAVDGFEALVRWDRPGRGIQLPKVFLPQAERSSLICDVDRWVLHRLRDVARGRTERVRFSANVSRRYLADANFTADVADLLADLPDLALEVNERVLREEPRALAHLKQVRSMGVSVVLDDFGLSYDSILRLGDLPVDVIKTHPSLLDLDTEPSRMLLQLTITVAASHGLPVIAQGVEHPHQLELLQSLHCDFAQGYHFGRPAPRFTPVSDPGVPAAAGVQR